MAHRIGKYKVSKQEHDIDLNDAENNTPNSLVVDTDKFVVTQGGGVTVGSATNPGDNNLRVEGTLTQVGIPTFTAAAQFNGGYAGARTVVDLDGTTATPTVAQSGTIFTFDGSACEVTLPTCAAGLEYFFVVDTTQTGNAVITTQSADKINGAILKTTAAYNETNLSDTTSAIDAFAATTNTLTFNGSTQGGVIGTFIHIIGLKANAWHASGVAIASGNLATSAS